MVRKKHVHFIGICGVAMAPIAVLYKKLGWKVTGSDRAFFPPMSTYLGKRGIKIMPGFKAEHLEPRPDLVVVQAFMTKKNSELARAIKEHIPYKAYGEILPGLVEKSNSIVVAGSRGKTSVAALVAWMLEKAGRKPSFMIGGMPQNFSDGVRRTTSTWSVLEGDEYPLASWKKESRFLSYHPRYLVLTAASWDHQDIFPTEKSYRETFRKLVCAMPKTGFIIANRRREFDSILAKAPCRVFHYSRDDAAGLPVPFAGDAWQENAGAAVVLARHLGISDKIVANALRTFRGIKRRQEVRYEEKNLVVIDDNAHSPEKVVGTLGTIRAQYPHTRIIAIYEPGGRNARALANKEYRTCFQNADYIFFPRTSGADERTRKANELLYKKFGRFYPRIYYIADDKELIGRIQKTAALLRRKEKVSIVFMSQKGFRGMIDELIENITQIHE